MSTNHKPEIPDGSEAIWGRMRLILFTQRFEAGKGADPKLPAKLREELPGVLAWAVRGCVDWGGGGLGTAAAVERATSAYRTETDVIKRFFADVCAFGPDEEVTRKELFDAYEEWCIDNGETAMPQRSFTSTMHERGVVKNFEEGIVDRKRGWVRISVPQNPSPPPFEKRSAAAQKSWKHEGGERSVLHISEDYENFSGQPLTQERFSENGKDLQQCSTSAAEAVTTPLRWTEDGVEWEYLPDEESE